MLCGSFSKTLAPGYRVGYVAPGRYRDAVERLKFAQTIATATLPQMAIADFLENGGYERHLRRLRRALADQVGRVSDAVAQHFPAGTRISRPRGGFLLWVEMPPGKNALELHDRALAARDQRGAGAHLLGQAAVRELPAPQLRVAVVGAGGAGDRDAGDAGDRALSAPGLRRRPAKLPVMHAQRRQREQRQQE